MKSLLQFRGIYLTFILISALFTACSVPSSDKNDTPNVVYDFSERLDYAQDDWDWDELSPGTPESKRFLLGDWGEIKRIDGKVTGQWVSGKKAHLRLWLSDEPQDLEMSIALKPYIRSYLNQKLTLKVNGSFIAAQIFKEKEEGDYCFNLPSRLLNQGENRIDLIFRYAGNRKKRAGFISSVQIKGALKTPLKDAQLHRTSDGKWIQEPNSKVSWPIIIPRQGTLRIKPEWIKDSRNKVCVALLIDGRRFVLKRFNEPAVDVSELSLKNFGGKNADIEFEVVGSKPVEWGLSRITGKVTPDDVNTYLLTIDSLRADHVSAYGYPYDTTPAFDQLAEKGVLFLRANSASNESVPSFASMLTGRYPQSHGILRNGLEMQSQQLPLSHYLGKAGFATACFVNWRLLSWGSMTGKNFDDREVLNGLASDGPVPGPDNVFTRAAIWIEEHADQQHFLWLQSQYLHFEEPPPDMYRFMFHPEGTGVVHSVDELRTFFHKFNREQIEGTPEDHQSIKALHDGFARMSDDHIGWFLNKLTALGLDPYSAIIVTSDHGQNLGENHRYHHVGRPFQHLLKIPLVMKFPGVTTSGQRQKWPAETIDIAPTILDYYGITIPRRMQGESWIPYFRNPELEPNLHPRFGIAKRGNNLWWYAVETEDWFFFSDMEEADYLFPLQDSIAAPRIYDKEVTEKLKSTLRNWLAVTPDVSENSGAIMSDEVKAILQKAGYLDKDE